jgi:hypothetical protein
MTGVGLGGYQGPSRTKAEKVMAALRAKCQLRAALCAVQEDLDAAIPSLSQHDLQKLTQLMSTEADILDNETAALREEVERESAQPTRAMTVQISRVSSTILAAEVERRISRGSFPSAQALIGEALWVAFGEAR